MIRKMSGEALMVCGAFFTAAMGAGLFQAHRIEPSLSPLAASFVRVCMNLILVAFLALSLSKRLETLWPRKQGWLWVWGIAGAVTVSTYFYAVTRLGMGEATFLQSSYAVFATLLAPIFLRQKLGKEALLALLGSVLGLFLLFSPQWDSAKMGGAVLALASGLAAAIAYLAVAKTGRSHPPVTVLFFWTLFCLPLHAMAITLLGIPLPVERVTWNWLFFAGAFGALAQYFIALAYQKGPVASVSAVSYLAPLLCVVGDSLFFGFHLPPRALLGASAILFFGVILPVSSNKRRNERETKRSFR